MAARFRTGLQRLDGSSRSGLADARAYAFPSNGPLLRGAEQDSDPHLPAVKAEGGRGHF